MPPFKMYIIFARAGGCIYLIPVRIMDSEVRIIPVPVEILYRHGKRRRHQHRRQRTASSPSKTITASGHKTNAIRSAYVPCAFSNCENRPHVVASDVDDRDDEKRQSTAIPSLGERFVANILDSIPGCTYLYDSGMPGLRGIKQGRLRFDFIVSVESTTTAGKKSTAMGVIEYQGFYHYHVMPGRNNNCQLYRQCTNDWLKRIFCTTHRLPYLELPYWLPPNQHEYLIRNFVEQLRYTPHDMNIDD